ALSPSPPVSSLLYFPFFSPFHPSPGALPGKIYYYLLIFYFPRLYFRCRSTSKRTLEEITHEQGYSFGHRRDRVHRRGNGRGVPGARTPRAGAGPPGGRPGEATPGTGG